jgi:Zn-dependent M32 family carboxypeptidase
MKRLLKADPKTGVQSSLVQDSNGETRIETQQEFSNLIKLNKQMNDDWSKGQMTGTQKHMQHVAEIPNVLYHELLKKLGKPSENPKAWKQWLNNNENRAFRTGGGTV